MIEWEEFEEAFRMFYSEGNNRPPKPIRLMVGFLMLQHCMASQMKKSLNDGLKILIGNFFCGFDVLQWQFPIDPSSLSRFRNRIGEEGMERILSEIIKMAIQHKVITFKDLKDVIVDITVMEKILLI